LVEFVLLGCRASVALFSTCCVTPRSNHYCTLLPHPLIPLHLERDGAAVQIQTWSPSTSLLNNAEQSFKAEMLKSRDRSDPVAYP
jgi:hypothetical protein